MTGVNGSGPALSYVICTNPRSGSELLCDGLFRTDLAGRPFEWFGSHWETDFRAQWGVPGAMGANFANYFELVLRGGKTANGIFGLKLYVEQFGRLLEGLETLPGYRGLADQDKMVAAFPGIRYIWLKRRDKTRQALSYYRACKTDVWFERVGGEKGVRTVDFKDAAFDPRGLQDFELIVRQGDGRWGSYFERNDLEPLVLYYEDLAADFSSTIRVVLNWLGLKEADSLLIHPPRLKRQADSITEEWLARYAKFRSALSASSYVICTNPRSGSELLDDGLCHTLMAGIPMEWFNPDKERELIARLGLNDAEDDVFEKYLEQVLSLGAGGGLFALKIHYYQFVGLGERMSRLPRFQGCAVPEMMATTFQNLRYIWLRRRDTVRQALSWHRACQEDVWERMEGKEAAPDRAAKEAVLDLLKIKTMVGIVGQNDKNWGEYFEKNAIRPLILYYEDLAADFVGTIRKVLDWLGIPNAESVSVLPPHLKRQADALTEEWLVRYLAFEEE